MKFSIIFSDPDATGITRVQVGGGFSYKQASGVAVSKTVRRRIERLAIPPAWKDVWICPDPRGHIQAVGKDAKGRRQYRYHPSFRREREQKKFSRLVRFARALPSIRSRVESDMVRPGLGRDKIVATVVHLLDTTFIRIGNASYAAENETYGLTTLKRKHVAQTKDGVRFKFKGKSGREWTVVINDRRAVRIVRACQELPGQHLFQYVDDDGARRSVGSSDINAYLENAAGARLTAKEFRTWAGTVLALEYLRSQPAAEGDRARQKNVRDAVKYVASHLRNTATVCKNSYIHPKVLDEYLAGRVRSAKGGPPAAAKRTFLSQSERLALVVMRRRPRSRAGQVRMKPRQQTVRDRASRETGIAA